MVERAALLLVVTLVQGVSVNAQNGYTECSQDTLRKCRKNIDDVLLGNGNTRRLELEEQCWRMRQNFDCVQWQSSMCLDKDDQEANSDIIRKAWRYLGGFCENFKNYWTKSCYQTARLKQCENLLSTRGRSVDSEACRSYINFRECATSAIERDCNSEDQRMLGVYLMDKGQQRSWNCPKDMRPVTARFASDTREVNSRDVLYSDSASSYGACAYDVAKPVQNCLTKFEDLQKTARDIIDEDKKEEKVCCGFVNYEKCVMDILEDKCGSSGRREGRNIVASVKSRMYYNCNDVDKSECSSATALRIVSVWLAFGFVLSFLVPRFTMCTM